jgi:hypothetical protein
MNLKMSCLRGWRRFLSTRYTRTLEAEVARLRAENRALLNSILGIAGVPPIPVAPSELAGDAVGSLELQARVSAMAGDARPEGAGAPVNSRRPGKAARPHSTGGAPVMPMRRRSWHQITRTLEFESARKKPQEVNSQT